MKKLIAVLLASMMVVSLASCGSGNTDSTPDSDKPAESSNVSESTDSPDSSEAGGSDEIESLTITFNCSYQQNETGGMLSTYFKDYLEDATDGAITVKISYGGTLFGATDELDACGDGAIDMMIFGHTTHSTELPIVCAIPDFAPDSVQNAFDYFTYVFSDEAAGAAISAEAESYGVKYLSVNAGGANVFLANFPFDNLTDLLAKSTKFGSAASAKFEAVGFSNVVSVMPWDYYTGFDTGLMDAGQMEAAALKESGVYEVAPYWMYDNTFAAGNFMTVCLDWWNGLSEAQQNAIQDACDATAAYSIEYQNEANSTMKSDLEALGVTFVDITDAEFDTWWAAIFETAANTSMTLAKDNGTEAETLAVLEAAAAFTNYDFDTSAY